MLTPTDVESLDSDFTRRSETESVCLFCFLTVRANTPGALGPAEDSHRRLCPINPRQRLTQL